MRTSIYLKDLKKFCLLLLTLLIAQNTMAQRERNYIYLLDCTKSMKGYNNAPDIWEPTKNYLKTDIERQTPALWYMSFHFKDNAYRPIVSRLLNLTGSLWKMISIK